MERGVWRGFKYNGNKKKTGSEWTETVGNGGRFYCKTKSTPECSAWREEQQK